MEEKMNALMNNEEFNASFEQVKNADDVVALYARYGVEVPVEIAQELFEPAPAADGELLESDLEDVAGGGIVRACLYRSIFRATSYPIVYVSSRMKGDSRLAAETKATRIAEKVGKAGFAVGLSMPGL